MMDREIAIGIVEAMKQDAVDAIDKHPELFQRLGAQVEALDECLKALRKMPLLWQPGMPPIV